MTKPVVLVTGAVGGIGKEICGTLVKEGWQVAAAVRKFDERSEELSKKFDGSLRIYEADISKFEDCERMIEAVVQDFGKLDALVNNAGITRDNLVLRMTPEDFDAVIDTNLKSAFYLSKLAFKIMMKARYGKIVNITSFVGIHGNAGQANYSAAKAGLIGLTKSNAREFAPRGVLVNAVAPGFIESPMTDVLTESVKEEIFSQIPIKKFGTPKNIADMVEFLLSDRADYITGQVFSVDGGMSI